MKALDRPAMLAQVGVTIAAALCITVLAPFCAQADTPYRSIEIGQVTSVKSCSVYEETAGSSSLSLGRSGISASESWRSWFIKDCVRLFPTLKASLSAALASTGTGVGPALVSGAGDLKMSFALSDVAETTNGFSGDGVTHSVDKVSVNADLSIRDRSGTVVFGSVLTKSVDVADSTDVGSFSVGGQESGQGTYARLQHEVALAAARAIRFHFRPLAVVAVNGKNVTLNYGAPLLQLGATVQLVDVTGAVKRVTVVGADANAAYARSNGADLSRVAPNSLATYLEADDPAANGRMLDRVELP